MADCRASAARTTDQYEDSGSDDYDTDTGRSGVGGGGGAAAAAPRAPAFFPTTSGTFSGGHGAWEASAWRAPLCSRLCCTTLSIAVLARPVPLRTLVGLYAPVCVCGYV